MICVLINSTFKPDDLPITPNEIKIFTHQFLNVSYEDAFFLYQTALQQYWNFQVHV
jgi:hypothetical protein